MRMTGKLTHTWYKTRRKMHLHCTSGVLTFFWKLFVDPLGCNDQTEKHWINNNNKLISFWTLVITLRIIGQEQSIVTKEILAVEKQVYKSSQVLTENNPRGDRKFIQNSMNSKIKGASYYKFNLNFVFSEKPWSLKIYRWKSR